MPTKSQATPEPGFVYFLSNPSLGDWMKIGKTVNPTRRISQLNTAAPLDFEPDRVWMTSNRHGLERLFHAAMAPVRTPTRREFFEVKAGVQYHTEVDEVTGEEYEVRTCPSEEVADFLESVAFQEGFDLEEVLIEDPARLRRRANAR
ncbi:MAG: nuclease family protein [Ramlibacter sp.]|jgi:hypothetical protein|nr:nuclease family protein [Ramlibacter sp.]